MKKRIKFWGTTFFLLVFITYVSIGYSQPPKPYGPQPEVGKMMPEFVLDNITYYKANKASLKDFQGKWLILDFWTTTCAACIRSFPKLDSLQAQFSNEVQIVLVGLNSVHGTLGFGRIVQETYEKFKRKFNLNLVSAYDSTMFDRWGIWSVPHIISIDPSGVVRSISDGSVLNKESLKKLLSGQKSALTEILPKRPEYDISKFPGSQNDKLIYRSILTRGNGEKAVTSSINDFVRWNPEHRKNGVKFVMQPLINLYRAAFIDEAQIKTLEVYPFPVLQMSNQLPFLFDNASPEFKGLYNYNLAVDSLRSNDALYIRKIFQQELKSVFGFDAHFEKRPMPVWVLKADPAMIGRIRTNGHTKSWNGLYDDVSFTNFSIAELIEGIHGYHQLEPPIIDETGINFNIDITLNGFITDLKDVQKALKKNGLTLEKGEREMKVLVIKDPSPEK